MNRLFFVFLLLVFVACQQKEKSSNTDVQSISLDCSQTISIHDLEMLGKLEILQLDSAEALFGEIDRIIRYKDRIYLMDKRKTRSVYVYDCSGHSINKISKYGQGPEEYLQLTDMFVDPSDASLNIVTSVDRKIMKYDLMGPGFVKL